MQVVSYDGSFVGWLTAVFDVYEYRYKEVAIVPPERPLSSLFSKTHVVSTDKEKAARVWKGVITKVSARAAQELYIAFLSGIKEIENILLRYIQHAFASKRSIERDYSHEAVLNVVQVAQKVRRERHRMEAFVRFQLTGDGLYYAIVQPDYNVLPLISEHFEKRYADQRWMIYDAMRRYGLYYDLESVTEVTVDFDPALNNGTSITAIHDEKEELYQALWKQYFDSVNIASRKNMPLHIRHMPKRYWKYLPEKWYANRSF